MFGGHISSGVPGDDGILTLQITSITGLQETGVAPWVTRRVGVADLVFMLARGAGFSPENIQLEQSMWPSAELFEVVQPVIGFRLDRAAALSPDVRLVPSMIDFARNYPDQSASEILFPRMAAADCFAVTYVGPVRWLSEAEDAGIGAISRALEWVVVQLRNGESMGADLRPNTFDRAHTRGHPQTSDLAMVTGMVSGRSWLREINSPVRAGETQVAKVLRERLPALDDPRSQLAYAAFRRAADETEQISSRVGALWEALEYYAVRAPERRWFSRGALRSLKTRAADGLTDEQAERLNFALSQLNSSSLQDRIWRLASSEGVFVSAGDREVIAKTRRFRNAMLHGAEAVALERDEVNYATSVVARLLIGSARAIRNAP